MYFPLRRRWSFGLSICALVAFASVPVLAADPPAALKGTFDLVNDVVISTNVSEDKQAATVLFRNLNSQVRGKNAPTANVRSVTVDLGIDVKEETRIQQFVRGTLDIQPNAHAVLLVQAAGKTHLVDLKKAREAAEKATAPPATLKQAEAHAAAQYGPAKKADPSGDILFHVEGTIAKGSRYQVTLVLMTESVDGLAQAVLNVTSLDVDMKKLAK